MYSLWLYSTCPKYKVSYIPFCLLSVPFSSLFLFASLYFSLIFLSAFSSCLGTVPTCFVRLCCLFQSAYSSYLLHFPVFSIFMPGCTAFYTSLPFCSVFLSAFRLLCSLFPPVPCSCGLYFLLCSLFPALRVLVCLRFLFYLTVCRPGFVFSHDCSIFQLKSNAPDVTYIKLCKHFQQVQLFMPYSISNIV